MPPGRQKPEKVLRWDFVPPARPQGESAAGAAQGDGRASPYSSARPPSRASSSPASSSSATAITSG
eukprot:13354082-Alexandrium_andersonii.AAC.1